MKKIGFEEFGNSTHYNYRDADLLVTEDLTKLPLKNYENTTLKFIVFMYCSQGCMQVTLEGREHQLRTGDCFLYLPGQTINEVSFCPTTVVRAIAFEQRALEESFYLNKYFWKFLKYVRENPVSKLTDRKYSTLIHYYELIIDHAHRMNEGGSFHHDVVRLLFQSMMFELMMFLEERLEDEGVVDVQEVEAMNSSVSQKSLVFNQFMRIVAETGGKVRNVSVIAEQMNVSPRYLFKCVKDESGHAPLQLIHEVTMRNIKQQLRYTNKSIKEIASEMKFPTISFFGKFVREHLGVSPREFRKRHLGEG